MKYMWGAACRDQDPNSFSGWVVAGSFMPHCDTGFLIGMQNFSMWWLLRKVPESINGWDKRLNPLDPTNMFVFGH